MNGKQKRFAQEYIKDLNAAKAAIRAGYSARTAETQGPRLYRNVQIRAYADKLMAERSQRLEKSADTVVENLWSLANANIIDFLDADGGVADVTKLPREITAAIQEITVDHTGGAGDGERRAVLRTRVKLVDKLGANQLMGKHFGMFRDKVELTGKDGEPLQPISVEVKFVKPE